MDPVDRNIVGSDEIRNYRVRPVSAQLVVVGRRSGLVRVSLNSDEISLEAADLHGYLVQFCLFIFGEGNFVYAEVYDGLIAGLVVINIRNHIPEIAQI